MKMLRSSLIFLLVAAGFSVINAATVKYELNSLEAKNEHRKNGFQTPISTNLESTTGNSLRESIQSAQLRHSAESMDKTINGNQIPKSSSQLLLSEDQHPITSVISQNSGISSEQNLFKSNRLAPAKPFPSDLENYSEQLNSPHQGQLYSRAQDLPNQRQYFDNAQAMHGQQRFYQSNQETPDQRQYFDQEPFPGQEDLSRGTSAGQRQFYGPEPEGPEQHRLYSGMQSQVEQQQLFRSIHPTGQQQQIYSNIEVDMNDQRINHGKSVQAVSEMKDQIYTGKQMMSVQTRGVQGNTRLSAFDTRKQPIVLPQGATMHSSSLVVSGMSNLPMLPAMVYNAGPLPSTHAIALSKGTAFPSIRQHLRTPYVRYVYSHLL